MRYFLLTLLLLASTAQANYAQRDDVKAFIQEMHSKHGHDVEKLTRWFSNASRQEETLKAIAKPAEGLPWHKYRKIFMTEKRINKGVAFWKKHQTTLERAEQKYGVPPEIITAIIGVETFYGVYKGKHPAFDTLVTLAFDYPKRAAFFRKELEQYLLLVKEENLDAFALKGSYAAAMGMPQFISSSYRHYAVDFDNDGRRDLLENPVDAIGSVANYFKHHDWKKDGPVVASARYSAKKPFVKYALKPKHSISALSKHGLFPSQPVAPSALATPIELELTQGHEYWLGLHNFYVITRYNHSHLYAMAVYQLSQAIRAQRGG